jgi:hypothetical protein
MFDIISTPTAPRRLFSLMFILLSGFSLTACLQSKSPLLTDAKPVLGDRFQLNLFEEFIEGKAATVRTSVFHWSGDRYTGVSGDSSGVKETVVQPLAGSDFIVQISEGQISEGKGYVYLLGRKLSEGTYQIFSMEPAFDDQAARTKLCTASDQFDCTITTRAQLDAIARAAAAKPPKESVVAVISVAPAQ